MEEQQVFLDRSEYSFFEAGILQGATIQLANAAVELRKVREHYTAPGDGADDDLMFLDAMAKQFEDEARKQGAAAKEKLDAALAARSEKRPSLRQRCKNAIIGLVEGFEKEA